MARNRAAWLVVLAAALFYGWRLLAPPAIGIADNGDFPKVTGPFWIGPAEGRAAAEDHRYFPLKYVRSTNYIWDSGVYSVEEAYTWLAFRISRPFSKGAEFDIRWMGLIHATLLLAALWVVARVNTAAACIAAVVFGDAAYLAYCNTFYMDAAGMVGLTLLVAAAVNIAVRGYSEWRLFGLTIAALLYVTAKIQHAPMGFAVAVLMVVMLRTKWSVAAAAVVAAAVIPMMHSAPQTWRGEALFDAVFYGITPGSPDPLADLKELGLGQAELPYVGLHVFSPGAPTFDPQWSRNFVERVPYWKVARFYAVHPLRTVRTLWYNLYTVGWALQEPGMGNYPRGSGMPPEAKAAGYWSSWRSWVLRRAPLTAPLWVIGCMVYGVWRRSRLAWLCAALAAMSAGEFCIAALGDAVETNRHLFLYHVLTETTICFALTRLYAAVRERGPA